MILYKESVDIICIDNTQECLAIRSCLEQWWIQVHLYLVGQAQDIVDLLDGSQQRSNYIFLWCHGDEEGIFLPELELSVAQNQTFDKKLTPAHLKEFLQLQDTIIISNGCATGNHSLAETFLSCWARYYIAPNGYPEWDSSLFYILSFCYFHFCNNLSLEEAHSKAQVQDTDTSMFTLYTYGN